MARVKVVVSEKGPGIGILVAELAGAEVRVGVQGEEAKAAHPNSEWTVGELAARHEMGLGVKERSFLRAWFDRNQARIQQQTRDALAQVAARKASRKKVMEQLGYEWVDEIRSDLASGKVRPALAPSTIKKKGHPIPLLESAELVNAITFRLFLAQVKSVADPALRDALRRRK